MNEFHTYQGYLSHAYIDAQYLDLLSRNGIVAAIGWQYACFADVGTVDHDALKSRPDYQTHAKVTIPSVDDGGNETTEDRYWYVFGA